MEIPPYAKAVPGIVSSGICVAMPSTESASVIVRSRQSKGTGSVCAGNPEVWLNACRTVIVRLNGKGSNSGSVSPTGASRSITPSPASAAMSEPVTSFVADAIGTTVCASNSPKKATPSVSPSNRRRRMPAPSTPGSDAT